MSTTLKFCVRGQRITRADAIVTVADAINYVYAEFAFCSDWDGLVKTAVFTRGSASYEALLDQDDRCLVPYEILADGPGVFKASVFAGNLITTAPVKVRIDASGWSFALESSQPPTPSVYQQIIDRMTDIETDMETATAAAEASAVLAESYAEGGTSTRQGEDTDNARYYSEQASGSAEEAAQIVQDFDDDVVAGAIAAVEAAGTEQIGAVNSAGATQVGAVENAGSAQTTAVNNAGSTQVGLVQAKGTEQVAAVQAKGTEVIGSIPQDYSDLSDDVSDLKSANSLHDDEIDNTVQTITFASDGSVQKIEHKRNNVIIRTDTFTFATNTITEVRTLNTGESLTIATNLTTLETTVTYAAA